MICGVGLRLLRLDFGKKLGSGLWLAIRNGNGLSLGQVSLCPNLTCHPPPETRTCTVN